jgi:hypothetical protein
MAKIKEAVILIDTTKLEVFDTASKKVYQFPFPQNSIADFEVVNVNALTDQLINFFRQNKFSFTEYVIILGTSTLFQKDFSLQPTSSSPQNQGTKAQADPIKQMTVADLQVQKQRFLDLVPFQNVISTEMPINKGSKVIAGNKEICEVAQASVMPQANLKAIFPMTIFVSNSQQASSLTPDIARKALKVESLKQYNMYNRTDHPRISNNNQTGFIKKQKKQDIMLVGIFAVLLLVLGVLLVPMFLPHKKAPSQPQVLVTQPSPSPSPTQTVRVTSIPSSSTSADLQNADLTVKITDSTKTASIADDIRNALKKAGLNNITTKTASTVGTQTTLIFGPSVDEVSQTAVVNIVKQFVTDPIIQKNNTVTSDILITVGEEK